MTKIDLTDAFDAEKMAAEGVSNAALVAHLIKSAKPIGHLVEIMRDGCGIAIVRNGDDVTLVGVDMGAKQ